MSLKLKEIPSICETCKNFMEYETLSEGEGEEIRSGIHPGTGIRIPGTQTSKTVKSIKTVYKKCLLLEGELPESSITECNKFEKA